jgi:hypothetical protein
LTYQARWRAALAPIANGASSRLILLTRYRPRRRKGAHARPFADRIGAELKLTLVVGDRLPADEAVEALTGHDRPARAWTAPGQASGEGSRQALAETLVALERELERDPPDAVLLADDSDAALAAALVATKLLVPVEAVEGATAGDGVNARLISQLAPTYTLPR